MKFPLVSTYTLPALQVPISGRLSTVKRAMKSPPGTPSPLGKCGVPLRLAGIALAVQVIARRILNLVADRQREAVVGQRLGERERDRASGRLADRLPASRIGLHWIDSDRAGSG